MLEGRLLLLLWCLCSSRLLGPGEGGGDVPWAAETGTGVGWFVLKNAALKLHGIVHVRNVRCNW